MAASAVKGEGWNISEDAYRKCLEKPGSKANVSNVLLNTDLKDIAVAGLPDDFAKSKPTKVSGPLVLQIQKIRNISAPTTRQESATAPRMFRFSLSDGFQTVPAIELESLHNVGFTTAPGSKLLLKGNATVNQGIVLLTNGNCKLLGGKVDTMYDKWQLNKDLLKLSRNTNRSDGPPPFVPFGQKPQRDQVQNLTGKFNSLEVASAKPTAVERDTAEFDAQRQAVITDALQQKEKKTYGGIKQVDAHAPLERAEFKRPERKPKKSTIDDKDPNVSDDEDYGRGRGRKGRRGKYDESEEHLAPGRPSTASTLFDFLGDRLAADEQTQDASSSKPAKGPGGHLDSSYGRSHDSSYGRSHDSSYGRSHDNQRNSRQHNDGRDQRPIDSYRQHSHNSAGSKAGYSQQRPSQHSNQQHEGGNSDRRKQYNSHSAGQQRQTDRHHSSHDNSFHRNSDYSHSTQTRGNNSASHQQRGNSSHGYSTGRGPWDYSKGQRSDHSYPSQQKNDNSSVDVHKKGGNFHSDSRRDGHSDSRRDGHSDSRRDGHSDSRRDGHSDSRRDGHSDSRRDGHSDSRKDSHSDNRRDGHTDSRRDGHSDSRRDGYSDSRKDGHAAHARQGAQSSSVANSKGSSSHTTAGHVEDVREKNANTAKGRYEGKMYSDEGRKDPHPNHSNTQDSAAPRPQSTTQNRKNHGNPATTYNPGDIVLAKYWEDGQFYKFQVSAQLSPTAVRGVFMEYGNTEEVSVRDIKPIGASQRKPSGSAPRQQQRPVGKPEFINYEGDYSQGLTFSRTNPRR